MVTEHHSNPRGIVNLGEPLSRIVIVDDHTFLAQSLAAILRDRGHDAWVATSQTVEAIVDEVDRVVPCLVLLDLALSDVLGSGLTLLPQFVASGATVAVITGSRNETDLARCYELGALGIIDKAKPVDAVLELVDRALEGAVLNEQRRHQLLAQLRSSRREEDSRLAPFRLLTDKERTVLELLDAGFTAKDIAADQYTSMSTVRSHVRSILMKLGVHSQLAAVAKARDASWIH